MSHRHEEPQGDKEPSAPDASLQEYLEHVQPIKVEKAVLHVPGSHTDFVQRENDRLDIAKKKVELDSLLDDMKGRKTVRQSMFCVTVAWLAAVLWIVVECGSGKLKLPESVLIALLTTTTINVIALFGSIVAYLFYKKTEVERTKKE